MVRIGERKEAGETEGKEKRWGREENRKIGVTLPVDLRRVD